jgi:hypothetical protein
MIQRIQSIFLLLSVVLTGVLPFFLGLWKLKTGQEEYFQSSISYEILFGLSSLLALISIFLFKNRNHQFVLNRLAIILNLILLGLFVYRTLNLSGETLVSEKGIGLFLPIGAIVMLVFANRNIKKDEDLVKSVDRLR